MQNNTIDKNTLSNIARSLWHKKFDPSLIDTKILENIYSYKNSNEGFTTRHKKFLKFLEDNRLSNTPNYKERYKVLTQNSDILSPSECYARSLMLGPESVAGYQAIPLNPQFKFPEIDLPQLKSQVGWHFFVGNATDENNNNYSIQIMFWQYTLLSPSFASELGLSDIENQVIEIHVAISDETNDIHYRAEPTLISGTTGLIKISDKPYLYQVGNNKIMGTSGNGDLFPAHLSAFGIDQDQNTTIEINIEINKNKDIVLQGDEGCCPSIDGVGTLYYSIPNISLLGENNYIKVNDKLISLKNGKFWYDHQWGTGFMPNGGLKSSYMRALQFLKKPSPGGWDWFMIQFFKHKDQECEMNLASIHKNTKSLYQTGLLPPEQRISRVKGKFINHNGITIDIEGSMIVDKWVRSQKSPNSKKYKITNTWYPFNFKITIDSDKIPKEYKSFSIKPITSIPQTGFFANTLEYSEGGSHIINDNGDLIGRGFVENTGYVDNIENILENAKLPIDYKNLKFNKPIPSTILELVYNSIYVLFKITKIRKNLKLAKGL
jgi:predicted secreted hydrolase